MKELLVKLCLLLLHNSEDPPLGDFGVSPNKAYPYGGHHNKDSNILGSVLGSPTLGRAVEGRLQASHSPLSMYHQSTCPAVARLGLPPICLQRQVGKPLVC